MKTKLTVEQAYADGYTYCFINDERLEFISDIDFDDLDGETIYLATKEGKPYQIPDNLLPDFIYEHICCQDEVYDEEDRIAKDVVNNVSFEAITEQINAVLSKHIFYKMTDIELIP